MVLDSGTHFMNPFAWASFGQGPFVRLGKVDVTDIPVQGTKIWVDPDKIEIMSKDAVTGHANIALEMRILPWDANDLSGFDVSFRQLACVIVNQWVSLKLASLEAARLTGYAAVVTCLNDKEALQQLNDELVLCKLQAVRVSVDPSGITLHPEYVRTIGTEIHQRRLFNLARLEADSAEEQSTRKIKLQIAQANGDCETNRVRAEADALNQKVKAEALALRVRALLDAGLSPQHVANLFVAEVSAEGLARAEHVVVGMNPGLIGLRGIDGVTAAGSMVEGIGKM